MNNQTIQWNGEFTTYSLANIAGKSIEVLSPEREARIRQQQNIVRDDAERLLSEAHQEPLLDNADLLHYPVTVRIHKGCDLTTVDATKETVFGYIVSGKVFVFHHGTFLGNKAAGKYFAYTGGLIEMQGETDDDIAVIISRQGFRRWNDDAGDASKQPRQEYVNGCQDVALTSPDKDGAPCTNMLFVNPNTTQDAHIHPSDRIGVIIEGSGIFSICDDPQTAHPSAKRWTEKQMKKGDLFLLPAGKLHRFTTETEPLTVFTFHPENDETDNPMMHGTIRSAEEAQRWRERFSGT